MGLDFLGGIANGYNGMRKGQDEELARQQSLDDLAYRKSQRAYQDGIQADESATRQRANTLRTDLAAIPESRTVQTPQSGPGLQQADGSEAPLAPLSRTTQVPLDEQLRLTATAQRKAGNMEGYLVATQEADKIGHTRSARIANEVLAGSQGMTPFQLANAAKSAYDGDPFPGKMGNITENADGSVNVTATNRDTGQATTRTYKTSDELRDGISAHYSPENFAALQSARLAEARKIREEQSKVHIIPAGGTMANNAGRALLTSDIGYVQGMNPDGTPGLFKGAGRLGVGAGSEAESKALNTAVDRANSGDVKLKDGQLMTLSRLTSQLYINSGRKMDPNLAAEVAHMVAVNPQLAQPQVDPETGNINNVYQHPTLGPMIIDPGIATARRPGTLKPEGLKAVTKQYVDSLPKEEGQSLVGAAFDQAKVKPIIADLYGKVDAAAVEHFKANPRLTEAEQKQWTASYKKLVQESLQKKLDLISLNHPKPKVDPPGGTGNTFSVANLLGGFGVGNSPAMRTRAPGMQGPAVDVGAGVKFLTSPSEEPSASPTSMGDDFESPGARAALSARVEQAAAGAAALTSVEAMRARQLGLI